MGCCLQGQGKNFGIRRFQIRAAKTLKAGLDEFAFARTAHSEDRAAIGEGGLCASLCPGQIVTAHGNGIFGAQAEFVTARIGCKIETSANILTGLVQKYRSRL